MSGLKSKTNETWAKSKGENVWDFVVVSVVVLIPFRFTLVLGKDQLLSKGTGSTLVICLFPSFVDNHCLLWFYQTKWIKDWFFILKELALFKILWKINFCEILKFFWNSKKLYMKCNKKDYFNFMATIHTLLYTRIFFDFSRNKEFYDLQP